VIDIIATVLGGVICLALLVAFTRAILRSPPKEPGSNDPMGGLPPGADLIAMGLSKIIFPSQCLFCGGKQ
jgi:hypothetical protein